MIVSRCQSPAPRPVVNREQPPLPHPPTVRPASSSDSSAPCSSKDSPPVQPKSNPSTKSAQLCWLLAAGYWLLSSQFLLLQQVQRHGSYGERHAQLNLHRQHLGVVGQPDEYSALAAVDDPVHQKCLAANGFILRRR